MEIEEALNRPMSPECYILVIDQEFIVSSSTPKPSTSKKHRNLDRHKNKGDRHKKCRG